MIPSTFSYVRATSVEEALGLLGAGNGTTKLIAGGQSLLPLLKLRLAAVDKLVDIGRIEELQGGAFMTRGGGYLIRPLTTYAELMESQVADLAVVADALPTIADVQVRNVGTIGGSIAHADPASDMPAVLLALDATIEARSSRGDRSIPIAEFFIDSFQSALEPDEILTEIRLPAPNHSHGSAYVSLEQPASGYAIVGVAAVVGRRGAGSTAIDNVRVGITGVGPAPYRASAVESALLAGDDVATAAGHAVDGVTVNGDIHADSAYRAEMAKIYTRRALEAAIARAG
jgi:carbon-monoxide dehydrogenase medium subunit